MRRLSRIVRSVQRRAVPRADESRGARPMTTVVAIPDRSEALPAARPALAPTSPREDARGHSPLNRREVLAPRAAGAAAAVALPDPRGRATRRARPGVSAAGRPGQMTGAQAAAAALACEGVPCVFGIPGAQNNEFWDAMKTLGMPVPARHPRGLGQRHGRRRGAGHRRGRRLRGRPRPGLTNAMTGIGEALSTACRSSAS